MWKTLCPSLYCETSAEIQSSMFTKKVPTIIAFCERSKNCNVIPRPVRTLTRQRNKLLVWINSLVEKVVLTRLLCVIWDPINKKIPKRGRRANRHTSMRQKNMANTHIVIEKMKTVIMRRFIVMQKYEERNWYIRHREQN